MVPEKQWRQSGHNMDKRTARKVHQEAFRQSIDEIRRRLHSIPINNNQADVYDEKIHVYIRKRPLLPHEAQKKEFDVVTSVGDRDIIVHECKMYPEFQTDMKHKFIESHRHRFSKCYHEKVDTEAIYVETTKELLLHAMRGGKSVCMMYGQTGSGKTYTMGGLFEFLAEDLFMEPIGDIDFTVSVTAIEIAGKNIYDLLRHRNNVTLCEDSNNNNMKLLNVAELPTDSSKNLVELLERVKSLRTTKSTSVNSQSSRSHLVCYINLRRNDVDRSLYGQLVLLDLAGRQVIYSAKDYLLDVTHSHYESCSERNEDSFYHDTIRHRETIEINKSHLALKQCIRAIGSEDTTGYVPYRSSTLTRILKDCLWAHDSRASVIATISPISIDTEHTLHTLYSAGQMLEENHKISTEKVDVREAGDQKEIIPVKEWNHEMAVCWLKSLHGGAFAKYACNLGSAFDGRQLIRLSIARFTQICGGSAEDAQKVYKSLRAHMAEQDEVEKQRRERNAVRRKTPTLRGE